MDKVLNKVSKKINMNHKIIFILFLLLSSLFLFIISGTLTGVNSIRVDTYTVVTVGEGDTLWEIALEHNTSNKNIRAFLYDIKQLNQIDGGLIRVGDRIKIPNY